MTGQAWYDGPNKAACPQKMAMVDFWNSGSPPFNNEIT